MNVRRWVAAAILATFQVALIVQSTQPVCEFGHDGFCSVMVPGTRTELDAWVEDGFVHIAPQTYDR